MRRRVLVGIVLSTLVAGASPALAQPRPFRGLFGAEDGAVAPPESLELTASMFGVHDDHLPQFRGRTGAGPGDQAFYYNDLRAGLWYTRRGRQVTFATSGSSSLQHIPQVNNILRSSHAGAVGIAVTSRRSTFGAEQRLIYSPFYRFRLIPVPGGSISDPTLELGQSAAADAAFAVAGRESFQHNTGLSWAYQTDSQSTLNLEYRHEYIDYLQDSALDWRLNDARASWSRALTRNAAFVAGYGFHERDVRGNQSLRRHDINIGVDYNSELAFSPRTRFDFSVGSTVVSNSRAVSDQQTTYIRMIGQASLDHELSRLWHLGASYERGTQYVEGISQVFSSDSISGSVSGYLGRRVNIRATTGYSTGALQFSIRDRGYDTHASTARVRVAVSRMLAAEAAYLYYRFVFSDAVTLPTGIPSRENRHVFRVGLTTWFPLLP